MKITALEEYGLRCLVRMARTPLGGSVTVAEIAETEGLTTPYVGKLMATLRQAKFVESVRGRGGGYVLARSAEQITVEEVLNALGEPLFDAAYCSAHPGTLSVCAHNGDCSIRSVWQVLGEMIHQVLRGTTLADLCMQEARVASHVKSTLPDSLLRIGAPALHSPEGLLGCAPTETTSTVEARAPGAEER